MDYLELLDDILVEWLAPVVFGIAAGGFFASVLLTALILIDPFH